EEANPHPGGLIAPPSEWQRAVRLCHRGLPSGTHRVHPLPPWAGRFLQSASCPSVLRPSSVCRDTASGREPPTPTREARCSTGDETLPCPEEEADRLASSVG